MDRTQPFSLAMTKLRLTVQAQATFEIDDTFVTEIQIGNVLARNSGNKETKKFSGKPAHTKDLSIQSAYNAVLNEIP